MNHEPLPPAAAAAPPARPLEGVLLSGAETSGAFALATLKLPPHSAGPPLHAHAGHAEGHYVLSGILAVTIAERTVIVQAGAAVAVAPGVAHTCWNPAAAPAVVLLIRAPAGLESGPSPDDRPAA
jgi:mannose-6-phosphate isomerase-like protein (cupin superfamily)